MPEPVACKRHPSNETRLRCQACGDPICPQCAVQTPVGQKCPADAKQARSARALGTPAQTAKAIGAAIVLAGVGGFVLSLVLGTVGGFFSLLLSYGAGHFLAEGVRRAAEGNGSSRFRTIAMVAAGAMVAVLWIVLLGTPVPGGFGILTYPVAVYAAGQRFPWS